MPPVFDIETGPLPMADLKKVWPKFNPGKVAYGNTKLPEKRQVILEKAKAEHTLEAFSEKAALSGKTGRVIAIGYYDLDEDIVDIAGVDTTKRNWKTSEANMISEFWAKYLEFRRQNEKMIGVNIFGFDLKFLRWRSIKLGVSIPQTVRLPGGGRYDSIFVDLMKEYVDYEPGQYASFEEMALFFETGGKNVEDISGADFHKLWESDRDKAIEYLTNDVKQPAIWADRMEIL